MRIAPGIAALLLVAAGTAQTADTPHGTAENPMQAETPVFASGDLPVTPEEYAALPKVSRHRAWLPKVVDLTADYPEPGFQGIQPNCVAWATTYAARSFLLGRNLGRQPKVVEALSPAYVYNRLRPAGSQCTTPIRMPDALNLLKNEGTVSFGHFPDDRSKCAVPAPDDLRAEAAQFRIADWRAIDREVPTSWRSPLILDDVKGALARGVPVVFVIPAAPDFIAWRGSGIYKTDVNTQQTYHAMALVGYDEDRQAFRLINSWGKQWGDGGYAWIDYASFRLLAGEAYAMEAPVAHANAVPPSPKQAFDTELGALQCGAVQVRQVGGRQVLTGYGGVQSSLDKLRAAATAYQPAADWQVAYHPWPQCEAETTLGPALGGSEGVAVQVVSDTGAPRTGDPVAMRAGDRFGFVARTTAARPYLSIVYLQADGSAVELYRGQPAAGSGGRREVTLGTGGAQQVRFQVGPPFGDEVLIAVGSTQPLFGAELSSYATERQFLTALRAHLLAAPRGTVTAAVLRLKTVK